MTISVIFYRMEEAVLFGSDCSPFAVSEIPNDFSERKVSPLNTSEFLYLTSLFDTYIFGKHPSAGIISGPGDF